MSTLKELEDYDQFLWDDATEEIRTVLPGVLTENAVRVWNLFVDATGEVEERQAKVIARQKDKIRNYRTGIKNLQRAHEALLHRFNALKQTTENAQQLPQLCSPLYDGPYSPVRFNNEQDYAPLPDDAVVTVHESGAVSVRFANGATLDEADRPE